MSFSSEIKENLSKTNNLTNKIAVKYELIGYLISNNISCEKNKIKYTTINQYNINRFSKLISNLKILDFKIDLKGKKYSITCQKIKKLEEIAYQEQEIIVTEKIEEIEDQEENCKALIRGAFLGGGSMNDPENKYHLEITFSTKQNAMRIKKILDINEIITKELERKKGYSLYMKEGEEISKFLAFIGASKGVLRFEEIRVLREIKNNINRKVNCETANITKTVGAAVKQIEHIKLLKKTGEFDSLPDSLKEIASLRLEHPEATLTELGQMLQNPIGKSGVNHRLNSLMSM